MMRSSGTLLTVLLALAPAAGCRPTGFCESDDQCSDGLICGAEGRCVSPGGDGGGGGGGGPDGGDGGRPDGPKPTGTHLVSLRFGQENVTEGIRIAADRDSNILLVGRFSGTSLDVGGGPLTYRGPYAELFVAKFAPDGKHLWSKLLGTGLRDLALIASDGTNLLVTGHFSGTANLGGGDLNASGATGTFLVKLGPDGRHLWSTRISGSGSAEPMGVGTDPSGAVLLLIWFNGTIDRGLPGGATIGTRGQFDPLLVKLSPAGEPLWYRQPVSASGLVAGRGLAVDRSGAALVVGTFEQPVDFGGGALRSAGKQDVFLVKYSAAGDHVSSRSFGGSDDELGQAVAADPGGDVVIAGTFRGPMANFGGAPLSGVGFFGGYVARYTSGGAHVWSRALLSPADVVIVRLAVDPFGDTIVGGYFVEALDLGGSALIGRGGPDVFMVKHDPAGALRWSRGFGDAAAQYLYGLATDPAGNALLTGTFAGAVDFGGGALTPRGSRDAFLVKLAP